MTKQDQVMKHTAGESLPPSPWYVDPDDRPNMEWNNHILSADGNTVCFMAHNPDDNTKLENAARLLASAPDLLEALKGIVADDDPGVSLADQRACWDARMKAAKDAILKAEGGAA